MANYSFWEDALHSKKYDLIVVGGGITGQSTAYFYKKAFPKANILVIDRGTFPIGASTRNAGFACIGTIGEHLSDLEIEDEIAVKNRIIARYNGLLLLREILGDDVIDYEHCGGWEFFDQKSEFEKCSAEVDRFNAWMVELLGEKEMYRVGKYQGYPSIFNKVEGMLHPGKMMQRLHEMNIKSGVEFRWNSPVKRLDTDLGRVFVEEGSPFHADKIVVATNAFSGALVDGHIIKPGRGYVFITKPLKNFSWKGTFHYNKGYVYFRNLGEDRLLLGGGRNVDITTEETTDFGVNNSIKNYLIGFANTVIKLPKNWEIEREWSGIMGFTETKSPHIKQIGECGLLVAGLSGMGVALGMQLGKTAASTITTY